VPLTRSIYYQKNEYAINIKGKPAGQMDKADDLGEAKSSKSPTSNSLKLRGLPRTG